MTPLSYRLSAWLADVAPPPTEDDPPTGDGLPSSSGGGSSSEVWGWVALGVAVAALIALVIMVTMLLKRR